MRPEVGIDASVSIIRTYLHVTFRDVKGCDSCMGSTAREDTTNHAVGVVLCVMRDGAEASEE